MSTDTKSAAPKKSYKELIITAITTLKERNGSSRQAIKKYISANFPATATNFDSQFNLAIKRGVTGGYFVQPKGPSGPIKLNKAAPEAKKPTVKKVAAPKKATPKKTAAPKKAAVKKATPAKKATTSKKTVAKKVTKKTAVPKKATPKKVTKKVTPKKK